MNQNLKTVALAASLVTLFTACGSNKSNSNRKNTTASAVAQGEKAVTAMTLKSVFGVIEGYSENDTAISDQIKTVSITYERVSNDSQSGSISNGSKRKMDFAIQLEDSGNSIILATLDDTDKLKVNTPVEMTVSSNDEVNQVLGGTPTVQVICADAGCQNVGVAISVKIATPAGVGEIAPQYAHAGYLFNGTTLKDSQGKSKAATPSKDDAPST